MLLRVRVLHYFVLFCYARQTPKENIQKGYINKRICPGTGVSEETLGEHMKREKSKAELRGSAWHENSQGGYSTFTLVQTNTKVTF